MNKLRMVSLALSAPGFAALLAACPDGAGLGAPGQDGGVDAAREASPDKPSDAGPRDGAAPAFDGAAPLGSGALCGVSGRDDCGAFLLCDPALGCVACLHDTDCPVSAPRCLQGACVACVPPRYDVDGGDGGDGGDASSADCQGAESRCWATDDACHAACTTRSGACPAASTCDLGSGACVACSRDADCGSGGVCSTVTRRCVECEEDATCASRPGGGKPRCRALTGTCQTCLSDDDCGHAAPICDPVTFTCRVGCSGDGQCPGQECDRATATCIDIPVDASTADAAGAGDGG